jgi:hypothetical protein
MKKLIIPILIFVTVSLLIFSSCTENTRVKQFGGTATLDLPKGEKFVNVTWKEHDLWLVTKKVDSLEKEETYYFTEKSSHGIYEGQYIIQEHR